MACWAAKRATESTPRAFSAATPRASCCRRVASCSFVTNTPRDENAQLASRPYTKPRTSKPGCAHTETTAPSSTASSEPAVRRPSVVPRAESKYASTKLVSGSRLRTVSEKEACRRPSDWLSSRKPRVYATDTQSSSRGAEGIVRRSSTQHRQLTAAAITNCARVSERAQPPVLCAASVSATLPADVHTALVANQHTTHSTISARRKPAHGAHGAMCATQQRGAGLAVPLSLSVVGQRILPREHVRAEHIIAERSASRFKGIRRERFRYRV